MKDFSTPCWDKMMDKEKNNDAKKNLPCKQTVSFLTQFARVYHAEPVLQKNLCGFILN
ncbi:MAG: hypothetical protein LBQ65_06605 [Tannerellaceae bacterium]|jgi:hypothetical protein|nr:hypothetical protein [Tannerellaceae bacterium]